MAKNTLQLLITGKSESAEKALAKTAAAADKLKAKMASVSKVVAASFAGAGVAAFAFASKSANTFSKVGQEVSKLKRITGLGAEAASKLRFAFQQSGIDAAASSRALAAMSRVVVKSKDGMKDFGFRVRDAAGHVLPMNELLGRAADRLHAMKDGAAKNALAMKLFGKGGLDMVKVLGKGRKAFEELEAGAAKYGLVLTENNLDAVKRSVAGHRKMDAAMQGLQVQIGAYVLPMFSKLAEVMTGALVVAGGFVQRKLKELHPLFQRIGQVLRFVGSIIARVVVAGFRLLGKIIGWAGHTLRNVFLAGVALAVRKFHEWRPQIDAIVARFAVMKAWLADHLPGAMARVRAAVTTAVRKLREITKWLADFAKAHPKELLGALAAVLIGVVVPAFVSWAASALAAAAATALAALPVIALVAGLAALGFAVVYAYRHFKGFHDVVDSVARFMRDVVWPVIKTVALGIAKVFKAVAMWVSRHWRGMADAIKATVGAIGVILLGMARTVRAIITAVVALWSGWVSFIGATVRTIGSVVSGGFTLVKSYIVEPIKSAVGQVGAWVAAIPGFFTSIPGKITTAASGMFSGIKSAFRSAINWIIDAWNGLEFKIPGFDPPGPGPKFGGFTLGVPNIPRLHSGGMVPGSGEYPAILLGGERVLNRREAAAYNAGGSQVFELYIDGQHVEAVVRRRAQDREARTGKAWTA